MVSEWVRHLKTPKEKDEFVKYLSHSRELLDRLEAIIDGYIAELRRGEQSEDYSAPSWSHLQADRLGQLKSLTKIKRLINLKSNEI